MAATSASVSTVREHNLSLVLNLIRDAGSISRADIIRETRLSPTAVSALVNLLLESGFVEEAGVGQSSGGRRPILLRFNYGLRAVLSVDIGASHLNVIAMDLRGRIIARRYCKHDVINDPHGTIRRVIDMIGETLAEANLQVHQVLGIGVTIPTPLDGPQLDRMITYYMPAWEGIGPGEEIRKVYDLPIYLDNDANAGAMAEKWWGSGKEYSSLAFIKLGVGVGAGLIIDGQVYRGYNGAAGEIGHTTIEPNGRLCRCGNYGCMEAYVGGPGLVEAVRSDRRDAGLPPLPESELSVETIVDLALQGDPICRQVVVNAGHYLGVAVANLINLINPGLIVFGGELTGAGDLLFDAVRETVQKRVLPLNRQPVELVTTTMGEDVVAIGAATLALQNAFLPNKLPETLGLVERR